MGQPPQRDRVPLRVGEEILAATQRSTRALPAWAGGKQVECRVAARNRGGQVRSPIGPARTVAAG